jgi:AbrB family looped-hinge helix DNA binding protein
MPKSTITSKGQTTVPRQVREQLGVGPGDTLRWETLGSSVRVTVAERAFLGRRGSVQVGPGSVVADIREARRQRGQDVE